MGATDDARWIRTEGAMVAQTLDPDAVAAHLAGAGVVARLEWYPGTEHLLSVSVFTDEDGRLGTADASGAVTPGSGVAELADELGTAFDADVLMAGVHPEGRHEAPDWSITGEPPEVAVGPGARAATPADGIPEVVESEDTEHDARTVVVTSMAAHQVPLHATLLGRTVTAAEVELGGQPRRLVATTGPGRELGVLGWDPDAYPVLRLQVDDEDRTALLLTGPESGDDDADDGVALFSWAMRSRFVHGAATRVEGSDAERLATHVLGDDDDAVAFAAAVPGADADAVAHALTVPGAEGLAAFVAALGLPATVTEVLEGRADPGGLPGARAHEAER
ncbi:hypothetical protein, partial [Georgenia subflava]